MALKQRTLAFIGGGHITSIILENLTRSGKTAGSQLVVSDPDLQKLESLQKKFAVQTTESNRQALGAADFIFFNVPPRVVSPVLNELKEEKFPKDKAIISLAAGIPMKTYVVLGDQTTHLFFQAIIDTAVRLGIDRETSTKIAYQTINGSMELWNTRQVSPYNLISEASTPGGISTEITFTLEKKAFKAIITEALEAKKAAEFATSKYCTETEQSVPD
jgi:pyrroline-5-carboxylate reductase